MAWKERQLAFQREQETKRLVESHDRMFKNCFFNTGKSLHLPPITIEWYDKDEDKCTKQFCTGKWMTEDIFCAFLTSETNIPAQFFRFALSYRLGKEMRLWIPSFSHLCCSTEKKIALFTDMNAAADVSQRTSREVVRMLAQEEASYFSRLPRELIEEIVKYIPPNSPEVVKIYYESKPSEDGRVDPVHYSDAYLTVHFQLDESLPVRKISLMTPYFDRFISYSAPRSYVGAGRLFNTSVYQMTVMRLINDYPHKNGSPSQIKLQAVYDNFVVEGNYFGEDVDEFVNSACFTGDSMVTLVRRNGNALTRVCDKIENVKVGDYLLCRTHDDTTKEIECRVNNILLTTLKQQDKIVELSEKCRITTDHPVFYNSAWRRAADIAKPDCVWVNNLYNFEMEGNHLVVIDSFLCAPVGLAILEFEKESAISQYWGSKYWSVTRPMIQMGKTKNITFLSK